MEWPNPSARFAEYVRKLRACGHWEYVRTAGDDKVILRHKSGATVAYNLHDGGNDWNGARNFATAAARICGCPFIGSRGRKRSRKKVESSGFSLEAAVRDQRRFHVVAADGIDRRLAERDRLIAGMVAAAGSGDRTRICGIRRSLARVRDLERELVENFHQPLEPFDVTTLASEVTA